MCHLNLLLTLASKCHQWWVCFSQVNAWQIWICCILHIDLQQAFVTSLSSQESGGNTAGPQTSSARSERLFSMPSWCCLWMCLQTDTSSWKSDPLPACCTVTTAPPRSRIPVASIAKSRSSSVKRTGGHRSAYKWSPSKMPLGTMSSNAPPIWYHSGREPSPTKKEDNY